MIMALLTQSTVHTIAGLIEAVRGIAVAREDDHSVSALLQSHGRVHHQPLCTADSQVWVQEHYGLAPFLVAGHLDGSHGTVDGRRVPVADVVTGQSPDNAKHSLPGRQG
jgi:hypothetical protein